MVASAGRNDIAGWRNEAGNGSLRSEGGGSRRSTVNRLPVGVLRQQADVAAKLPNAAGVSLGGATVPRIHLIARYARLALLVLLALNEYGCTRGSQSGGTTDRAAAPRDTAGLTQLTVAPSIRRVWNGATVDLEGRPSPDGRFISATDWYTGNLALFDIASERLLPLTSKGSWGQSSDFAEASAISPDGRTVVFGWFSMNIPGFELRAMQIHGADSGKVRTIYNSGGAFVSPQAFTSDSRQVAVVVQRPDRTNQIILVSLVGAGPVTLKSFDWRTPGDLSVSPDGRWLAYDFAPDQKQPARDVYVMALDGTRESPVLAHKGNDQVVGWTKDGRHLLVASERGGTPGVWAIPIANGKAQGEPILVRADLWRIIPVGTTADGSIFYGLMTGDRDIYSAAFDPRTGKVASQPVSATGGTINVSPNTVAFSPDGQHVAYVVARGSNLNLYGPSDIVLRSLERGEVRRLSPDLSRVARVHWMPDGRSLLLRGADQKGRAGLYRITLNDGALARVYQSPGSMHNEFAVSRDGSRVYFAISERDLSASRIHELNLATSVDRVIYEGPKGGQYWGAAISSDGRELAIAFRNPIVPEPVKPTSTSFIAVVSVESGSSRVLYRFPEADDIHSYSGLVWSADQHIYFGASVKRPTMVGLPTVDLRRVAAAGGPATSLGLQVGSVRAFRMSDDGRRIAYGAGHLQGELWVMTPPDLTPAQKPAGQDR